MTNRISFNHEVINHILSICLSTGCATTDGSNKDSSPANASKISSSVVVCNGYTPTEENFFNESNARDFTKAFNLFNNDENDKAVEVFMSIEPESDYEAALVNYYVGAILLTSQDGRRKEAFPYLSKSVSEKFLNDSQCANTLLLLAEGYLADDNYQLAIGWYEKWLSFTCKHDPDVYLRLAHSYYKNGDFREALKPANKAIELFGDLNLQPLMLKIDVYRSLDLLSEAISIGEAAITPYPRNRLLKEKLASLYTLLGDHTKAKSVLEALN